MAIIAKENWKPVVGYEGHYEVSDYGRIRSLNRLCDNGTWKINRKGRIRKPFKSDNGYLTLKIVKNGKVFFTSIHRLVSIAFIPNPDNLPEVNHIDGDKENNCIENLEWCTSSYNKYHCYKTGLREGKKGIHHNMVKLTENDVYDIKILLLKKYSHTYISKIFNISRRMISMINTNKNWTHIQLKTI